MQLHLWKEVVKQIYKSDLWFWIFYSHIEFCLSKCSYGLGAGVKCLKIGGVLIIVWVLNSFVVVVGKTIWWGSIPLRDIGY